jgi:type IV secretory pathway TrbD component
MVCSYLNQPLQRHSLPRVCRPNIVSYTPVSHRQPSLVLAQALISFVDVLLGIFPWIALLFNVILIVILFAAARRRVKPDPSLQSSMAEKEKGTAYDA